MRILLMLLLLGSAIAVQGFDIYEFQSAEEEAMYRQLITELRCLKCQNQSIGDSDADIALDMRRKTAELINQGFTYHEVVEYFRTRYGDFVSYKPPVTPGTYLLWFGPGVVLLLGGVVVFRSLKRAAQRPTDVDSDEVEE